jgi:dynactin complex subunit
VLKDKFTKDDNISQLMKQQKLNLPKCFQARVFAEEKFRGREIKMPTTTVQLKIDLLQKSDMQIKLFKNYIKTRKRQLRSFGHQPRSLFQQQRDPLHQRRYPHGLDQRANQI